MRKKLFIIVSMCLLAVSVSGQSYWVRNDTLAHNVVWEDKLLQNIEFLSDSLCQGRGIGTRGGSEAAFWLIGKFKAAGLLPISGSYVKHFFPGDNIVGHNIVGMMPGSKKKACDKYIIIGAHYDHLGVLNGKFYPGADSNASGVSAMLSLCDMFSVMKKIGQRYGQNLIFVAFDGKQMDMAGSASLSSMIDKGELSDPVSGARITKDKISLVVNLDQIGSTLSPLKSGRKDYLIMLGSHTLKRDHAAMIHLCNIFYHTDLEISETYYDSEDFTKIFYKLSDHYAFAQNGIPAVYFTSGITFNTFKTYDLPESLDMEILRRRVILIYHWLNKLLGAL